MEPGIVAGEAVGAGTCGRLAARTRAGTWLTLPSLLQTRVAPAAVPHFLSSPPSPMASPPSQAPSGIAAAGSPAAGEAAPASFVKLAMRNMVRKGRQSLVHFGLTALGFTVFIVFVAWLGRPHLPQ